MSVRRRLAVAAAAAGTIAAVGLAVAPLAQAGQSGHTYLSHFTTVSTVASTVPFNGDQNPYGIFIIQHSTGRLHRGNVLISNFNNATTPTGGNLQGTGSTIVQVSPDHHVSLFAHITQASLPRPCPGGIGLTTALVILPGGWVVVGSTPSTNGMAATSGPGCLIVLNSWGRAVEVFKGHGINGPWDATVAANEDTALLFVDNVLNNTVAGGGAVVDEGTVLRLKLRLSEDHAPKLVRINTVGSGFPEQTSQTAFVLGPTGLGLGKNGTLYVASTQDSTIYAIRHALDRHRSAGTGRVVTSGGMLNMPLGLAIAPNGHVLTVNGGDGNIVETTRGGMQVAEFLLDNTVTPGSPPGAGALFGLAVRPDLHGVYFVDNATNTLNLLSR